MYRLLKNAESCASTHRSAVTLTTTEILVIMSVVSLITRELLLLIFRYYINY